MNDDNKAKRGSGGLLDRALSMFTEVRASETKMALLMTLTVFLILISYLIAKVVREPLIIGKGNRRLVMEIPNMAAKAAEATSVS